MVNENGTKLSKCFFSYIETRRTCFLFRLGDNTGKIQKRNQWFISLSESIFFLFEPSFNLVTRVSFREWNDVRPRYLLFTRENQKFQLENQMIRAIPLGRLQKIWAEKWGDAIFLLFEVSLADVDIFYSDSLSRNLAFNCFMFMPEISNRMVFVNVKHPQERV